MNNESDDLRPEHDFDFSKAVRGKYYQQYKASSNVSLCGQHGYNVFP